MDVLAAIRPDDWNVLLFLHVLGAMVMVGALILAVVYLWAAWRQRDADSLRPAFRSLLWVGLPGYLVMRVFAQLIYSEQQLDEGGSDPAWIAVGFAVSDLGLLFLVAAIVLTGLALRRKTEAGGGAGIRVATGLISVLLVAYVVAIWAMTTKPV